MDVKAHWERVYSDKTPSEVSWYQKEPTLSLELIRNAGLDTDAPIIDIGGGASVLVDRLLDEGYTRLSVLDISARALASAKARLGEQADKVTWYETDITRFASRRRFALWHDRAVFHFLTEKTDRSAYVTVLKQTLGSGGDLIIAAFAIGGPTRCSGLDIVQYDSNKLMAELGDGFEFVEWHDETHVTPSNKRQQFCYFHLIRV